MGRVVQTDLTVRCQDMGRDVQTDQSVRCQDIGRDVQTDQSVRCATRKRLYTLLNLRLQALEWWICCGCSVAQAEGRDTVYMF